jgi:hypothetical protein
MVHQSHCQDGRQQRWIGLPGRRKKAARRSMEILDIVSPAVAIHRIKTHPGGSNDGIHHWPAQILAAQNRVWRTKQDKPSALPDR